MQALGRMRFGCDLAGFNCFLSTRVFAAPTQVDVLKGVYIQACQRLDMIDGKIERIRGITHQMYQRYQHSQVSRRGLLNLCLTCVCFALPSLVDQCMTKP
jgi:hypothetical protein